MQRLSDTNRELRILAFLAMLAIVCAPDVISAREPNEANVVECNLWYKPAGFNLRLNAEATSLKEKTGPDFGKRRVSRGVIQSERQGVGPMLFVWDQSQRKLYFDLNKNLDLTDDVNNVFSSDKPGFYQFDDMHLERQVGDVQAPYVLKAFIFSGKFYQFTVLSGFEGQVRLGDKFWRVTLADNLDGSIGYQDDFMLSSPDSNFIVATESFGKYAPKEVFLDGRGWLVSYEFATAEDRPCVRMKFEEITKKTGKLIIDGQFVRYLILKSKRESSITVLDQPQGEVIVPVGEHDISHVFLDGGKAGLFDLDYYYGNYLTIKDNKPVTLTIGGPLKNDVGIKRVGRVLKLSCILKGSDGRQYKAADTKDRIEPAFAIFKGDKEIGSGTFSFG